MPLNSRENDKIYKNSDEFFFYGVINHLKRFNKILQLPGTWTLSPGTL